MLATRSLLFNTLFYLNLVVLMIIGLPTMLFGRRAVFALARLWGAISVWLLETICGLRLEYRGVENIPPGAILIAAKHQSFLETFALLKYAPDFAIILKRQLTYVPLFGLYLIVSQQIAIDRAKGRQALQQIAGAAKPVFAAGRQVFIYPEGTRRLPGAPPKYKQGAAALYTETGVACLPVAVNTGLFWRRHGFLRRPGVAVIEYLPVIAPGLGRAEFSKRLLSTIETACGRLNAEAIDNDPSLAAVLRKAPIAMPKRYGRLDQSLVLFYLRSRNNLGWGDDAGIRGWNDRAGALDLGIACDRLDRPHERSPGHQPRLLAGRPRRHADLLPILFVGRPVGPALYLLRLFAVRVSCVSRRRSTGRSPRYDGATAHRFGARNWRVSGTSGRQDST